MFENVGPNEALMSHLTKPSEINKNQTESEDNNDPFLDLELDSYGQIKSLLGPKAPSHKMGFVFFICFFLRLPILYFERWLVRGTLSWQFIIC